MALFGARTDQMAQVPRFHLLSEGTAAKTMTIHDEKTVIEWGVRRVGFLDWKWYIKYDAGWSIDGTRWTRSGCMREINRQIKLADQTRIPWERHDR